ncbi:MAG: pyridoxamine 5'-phosphate oxidase family protein [Promethearchaeota archaeon]
MVKYHLRRIEKEITENKEKIQILRGGKYAVISMCRENEAYLVTLSYGYDESRNALYFHCANEGQKIDFINSNSYVCGTVIEDNGYMEGCGQAYRSVIFRGKMTIIDDLNEKKHGFDVLLNHLEENPDYYRKKFFKNEDAYIKPTILRLDIEDLTGKAEIAES